MSIHLRSLGLRLALLVPLLLPQVAAGGQKPFVLMEWNVENLFDTKHDEGKEDTDFTPEGAYRWTRSRYWRKLDDVASVIAEAEGVAGAVPALIGLCEVENDTVLTDLCRRSALRTLGYEYVMTDSPDARGIDVALLYQPVLFRPLQWRSIRVPSAEQRLPRTRDILYVQGVRLREDYGLDTLHVVVVHLPSKTGGRQGDRNRRLAATTLWHLTDSIQEACSGQIVVMGDFNTTPKDRLFRKARHPLTRVAMRGEGSYKYRGVWQWIDHMLVRDGGGAVEGSVIATPRQLEPNKTYGGTMPRRTFRGPSYHGGVSDHLPLVWVW